MFVRSALGPTWHKLCRARCKLFDSGGPLNKLRLILTAAGFITAAFGLAIGYLVPVGMYCAGAFGLQKASNNAPDGMTAVAALTTCHINADKFAPILWTVVICGGAVFAVGLVWLLFGSRRRQKADSTPALSPTRRTSSLPQGTGVKKPVWPFFVGSGVMALGVVLGYSVPVGPNCSGAFTSQISAAGYDIASAMNGTRTNYSDQCQFAAGQQSGIYWGIMAFGAAVFILGLVLRSVSGGRLAVPSSPVSVTEELERLAVLLDRGLLTHEEFVREKAKLLEPQV